VIAAGFDGGVPTHKADSRALGQITGSTASRPATVAPTNGTAASGANGSRPATLSQRPYSTSAPSSPSLSSEPPSSEPPSSERPAESPTRQEPVVVPDSLEPVRTRASRSVAFDADDDLDVPDFLK